MKNLIYISLIGILFFGCKKYPEDGKISFKRPIKRLTNHKWKIEKLTIDGQDSSYREYYVNANFPSTLFIYKDVTLSLSKEKREASSINYLATASKEGVDSWRFESDSKDNIIFGGSGIDKFHLYRVTTDVSWEIRKLTNKELIIKASSNGRIHEVTFIPN